MSPSSKRMLLIPLIEDSYPSSVVIEGGASPKVDHIWEREAILACASFLADFGLFNGTRRLWTFFGLTKSMFTRRERR